MGFGPSAYVNGPQVASGSVDVDTVLARGLGLDINVVSLTGGTTPSLAFSLSRVGLDGIVYPFWTSAALTGAGTLSLSASDSISSDYTAVTNNLQGIVLGARTRFAWIFGGAVNPTSVLFTATLFVRS